MDKKLKPVYRMTSSQKTILAEYLEGTRSQKNTATHFAVARQNLPSLTNNILRHFVTAGKIDIKSLLKDY